MNCSQCGYANRAAVGHCARCGALLGAAGSPAAPPLGDDHTSIRPTYARDAGTPPIAGPATQPAFEVYPGAPGSVPAAPGPAPVGPAAARPWDLSTPFPGPVPSIRPVGYAGAGQLPTAPTGSRFAAHLLDGLVMSGLMVGIYVVTLVVGMIASYALSSLSYELASLAAGLFGLVSLIAYLGIGVGYVIWGWANGQTIGKRAMKIAVVNADTGAPIGYSQAFVRYLMMVVMGLPCYLGYFSILAADGRGWHDKAANSRVVLTADWPAPVLPWKR